MFLQQLERFQSTLRRTERHGQGLCCIEIQQFQSTLRRTERRTRQAERSEAKNFNPRSDERSDVLRYGQAIISRIFQSTLRRTERRKIIRHGWTYGHISIHAPTNGATKDSVSAGALTEISIHAPTNGATKLIYSLYDLVVFQSTLRRTERPG